MVPIEPVISGSTILHQSIPCAQTEEISPAIWSISQQPRVILELYSSFYLPPHILYPSSLHPYCHYLRLGAHDFLPR